MADLAVHDEPIWVFTMDRFTHTATGTAAAAATVAVQAGNNQTGTVGTAVAVPPAVVVKDQFGNPVPSVTVSFVVTSGGGGVTGASVATNSQGVSAVGVWTMGTVSGAQSLTATVPGLPPAVFAATAGAGAPATILIESGANQAAPAALPVLVDPSVRVRDQFGNAVPNASVTFTVTAGGGTTFPSPISTLPAQAGPTASAPVTDAQGIARTTWTLGPASGVNILQVSAGSAPPVTFAAKATWVVTRVTGSNPFTAAAVFAEDGINAGTGPNWGTPPGRPSLAIACFDVGRFVIGQIFAPTLITNSGAIAYRFDNGTIIGEIWTELAPSFRSLSTPTQAAGLLFAANTSLANSFTAAFAQFPGTPVWTPLFIVTGFNRILNSVLGACL